MKNNNFKKAIILLLNPSIILETKEKYRWYLFLFYPAFGWTLFFMQVYFSQHISSAAILIKMIAVSFALGYIVNFFIGITLTLWLRLIRRKIEYDNVISCISLSHTYMFFSLILGFIYRIFDPSVSVTFGITGLLCTLLPIYAGIRNLGSKNAFVAPLLATYVGVIMLVCWKLIMIIGG